MDLAGLAREEWSTLLLLFAGLGGMGLAATRGEWTWVALSGALVVMCLQVLQLQGWILQDSVIGD